MRLLLIPVSLLFIVTAAGAQSLQEVNGTRLFMQEMGKGEVVIVLHGGPGMNSGYLLPHLEPLARSMKIVLYDQRGCGMSQTPHADSLRLSFHVQDIESLREKLGVEKVHLLGHSWGGLLAIIYGAAYPNRVKSMILVNPTALSTEYASQTAAGQRRRSTQRDSLDRAEIVSSSAFKAGKADAYEKLLRLGFRHSFYNPENLGKLNIRLPDNYKAASQALFTGLSKDLSAYDYYGSINGFRFPMLIIHGRHDVTPLPAIERIRTSVGTSVLTVYEESGHFSFIEEGEKFTREVSQWIRAKSMRRRPTAEKETGTSRRD